MGGLCVDSGWPVCVASGWSVCVASGWPVCSQWVVYAVSFVVVIFPVLDRSVGAALGLKRATPYGCVCFLVWSN